MSNKKKRNKKYKGSVEARPTILKVSAVKRHPIHQWWVDNKQIVLRFLPIIGIVLAVVLVIVGLVGIILPR